MSDDGLQTAETESKSYRIGDAIPVPGFDTVPSGTNVLVSGPPMLGKQRLALELLAVGSQTEHAITVTPDTNGTRLRQAYRSVRNANAGRFHVIDCTGATGKGSMNDTRSMKYVSSPGDLTGIGMGIVKCTRDIDSEVERGLRLGAVGVDARAVRELPACVQLFAHHNRTRLGGGVSRRDDARPDHTRRAGRQHVHLPFRCGRRTQRSGRRIARSASSAGPRHRERGTSFERPVLPGDTPSSEYEQRVAA